MKRDEGLFTGLGLDVLEDLIFVIDEEIAVLMFGMFDDRHAIQPLWEVAPSNKRRTAFWPTVTYGP
jgi:hypothetical protein